MTTTELIEQAKECAKFACRKCQFKGINIHCQDYVMYSLAKRLEMAYKDLWRDCDTCSYRNTQKCKSCHLDPCERHRPTKWQWRGDTE